MTDTSASTAGRPAPRQRYVQCASAGGLHRIAYTEWGDPANPRVLLCVHGLTRSGRDFDRLAAEFAGTYRVVCPDVAGRGLSPGSPTPTSIRVPQYVADMVTLIARLNVETVDWFGTSMGGLIGLALAGLPETPIRKMLLNDVGPHLEPVARAAHRRLSRQAGAFRNAAAGHRLRGVARANFRPAHAGGVARDQHAAAA